MLLGEDLGGGHQCHLIASLQRLQRGQCSDHGLAGTHVALHQAHHRFVLAKVIGNFVGYPLLRAGRLETKVGQVLRLKVRGLGQYRRTQAAQAFAQALLRQLVGQQLFEGQAVLGPVLAFGELVEVGVGRRVVQVAYGFVQGCQLVVPGKFVRQPVGQAARAKQGKALLAQQAQALLGKTFGGRIDRRQCLFHRWRRLAAVQRAVLRVVDFQAGSAGAGFPIAAQVGAPLQALLLRVAEVVEAQCQYTAAVAQAHHQAAALTHGHIGTTDHTLDNRILARTQLADWHHARAVLVAQGQVEQHVLQVFQADLGEFLRHCLAHTFQYCDRDLRQLTHDSGRLFRRVFGDRAQADRIGEDLDGLWPRETGAPGDGYRAEWCRCRQRAHFDDAGGVVMAVHGRQRQDRYAKARSHHVTDGFQRAGLDRGVP